MKVLFNFIEKYGADGFNEFLEFLNDPKTSNLQFLAKKYHVTPARISQLVHHFFDVEYHMKGEIESGLKIYLAIQREKLDRIEKTNGLVLVIGGGKRAEKSPA